MVSNEYIFPLKPGEDFLQEGEGTNSIVQEVDGSAERQNINQGENGPVFGLRNKVLREEGSDEGPSGIFVSGRENTMGPRSSQGTITGHKNTLNAQVGEVGGSHNSVEGDYGHGEGRYTSVREGATAGHAQNYCTAVEAQYGTAEGDHSVAGGEASHAGGTYNETQNQGELAAGAYSAESDTWTLFKLGNGTGTNNRHTAASIGGMIGEEYLQLGDATISVNDLKAILEFIDGRKLAFTSNGDGTCNISGIGTYIKKDVIVPQASPAGETVVAIDAAAFQNNDRIESVKLPVTIAVVGNNSFANCPNLKEIYIDNASIEVENDSFDNDIEIILPSNTSIATMISSSDLYSKGYTNLYNGKVSVYTASDLRSVASSCNNGETYEGKLIVLEQSVDISSSNWTPIAKNGYSFRGSFDGRKHTIDGIKQTYNRFTGDGGLFGYVQVPSYGGSIAIKNFKLTSGDTSGLQASQGGYNAGTVISIVAPYDGVTGEVHIQKIWSTVNLDASGASMIGCGGILGTITNGTNAYDPNTASSGNVTVYIDNCRYSGTLGSPSAGSLCYGGIVGWTNNVNFNKTLYIRNCLVDGEIHIWGQPTLNKYDDNGGIIGYIKGNDGQTGKSIAVYLYDNIFAGQMIWRRDGNQQGGTSDQGFILGEITSHSNYTVYVGMKNNYYVVTTPEGGLEVTAGIGAGTSYITGEDPVTEKTMAGLISPYDPTQEIYPIELDDYSQWVFDGENIPIPVGLPVAI